MKNLIAFTLPTPFANSPYKIETGEANGYVAIPEGHPLYEKDYDTIHEEFDIEVHGGLTFSGRFNNPQNEIGQPEETIGMWIIGFDTCHSGDNPQRWPVEKVMEEANRLKQQCEALN